MRTLTRLAACAAFLVALGSSAHAADSSPIQKVGRFLLLCKDPPGSQTYAACLGYIACLGDILHVIGNETAHKDNTYFAKDSEIPRQYMFRRCLDRAGVRDEAEGLDESINESGKAAFSSGSTLVRSGLPAQDRTA
jgi:hypothetical protein